MSTTRSRHGARAASAPPAPEAAPFAGDPSPAPAGNAAEAEGVRPRRGASRTSALGAPEEAPERVPPAATGEGPARRRRGRPRKARTDADDAAFRASEAKRLRAYRERKFKERQAVRASAPRPLPPLHRIRPENRAAIEGYLEVRAPDLAGGSREAYLGDLVSFAGALERWAAADETDAALAAPGGLSVAGRHTLLGQTTPTGLLFDATRREVARWISAHLKRQDLPDDPEPWTRRTARRKLSSLKMFFRWAVEEEFIPRNPTDGIKIKRHSKRAPVVLSRGAVLVLFDYLERRIPETVEVGDGLRFMAYVLDAAVLRLLYHTALRVTEVCTLRLSSFFERSGEQFVHVTKKGGKNKPYPITGAVTEAVERYRRVRRGGVARAGEQEYLFLQPRTGRKLSRQYVWRRIRRLAREAQLVERGLLQPDELARLSPHKFRHARLRHFLEEGNPVNAAQALADHASIQTTNDYLEASETARLEAIRLASQPLELRRPGRPPVAPPVPPPVPPRDLPRDTAGDA